MTSGILGCSMLCPSGARTKLSINMLTFSEGRPLGCLRRCELAQVGHRVGQSLLLIRMPFLKTRRVIFYFGNVSYFLYSLHYDGHLSFFKFTAIVSRSEICMVEELSMLS